MRRDMTLARAKLQRTKKEAAKPCPTPSTTNVKSFAAAVCQTPISPEAKVNRQNTAMFAGRPATMLNQLWED